ncbi:MAG: (E)-4-hydroxy-3-methylbut-2-enyl-diphosphate synthase, partial [Solirubrobacteraceae bacterium]|nr:(E)-4-hydroxy-3-methylbut-2-enyl-diphosphate synthase [Solirubrobacteraceae bacterium]
SKRIVVDERAAAEGAAWLHANEDVTALTPERLAALEAAESAVHDGGDDVLAALDEAVSPVAGRRFTRA